MSSSTKKEPQINPTVTAGPRAILPNLRRFAAAPDCPQDIEETPTTICNDVLRAAHREAERIHAELRPRRADLQLRVEALLGVISYCYARGLFNSEEIERRLWQDEAFLATFRNEIPSAQKIRCFRRNHRENILAIIEQALQECAQRTRSQPPAPVHADASTCPNSLRHKAEQLLAMANIIDQLAAD
jgi:hypothetical protein